MSGISGVNSITLLTNAAAVWNAAATAYNESGTMGRKQNDALSLAKFIGLK